LAGIFGGRTAAGFLANAAENRPKKGFYENHVFAHEKTFVSQ
jgi:hypothetical protein